MPGTDGAGTVPFHQFEMLESRQLLSGAATPHEALLEKGFIPIEWHGEQVLAKPGRWVMKIDGVGGSPRGQLAKVNRLLNSVRNDTRAVRYLGDDGVILLKTPGGITRTQLRASLRGLRGFRSIEPDFAIWTSATSVNDPSFSSQWALHNAGQTGGTIDADIDAPEAWDQARGNGVTVAVVDTGIDYTHADLAGSIWRNPGEIAGNGIDDDRNGYVDDLHGWDFFNNDNAPIDDNGHGTHVAGIIAAAGDNALGVAGVAWGAKVMALKFLGADGTGTLSGAIAAINYATMMRRTYGIDVRVTNNSWVTDGYSSALYDAFRSAGMAGMLSVAAAGNGGADYVGDDNDATPLYPASFALDSVISVAATDHADALASFSNFGATSVDIAAPGVSILSTTPGGSYAWYGGSSMAAPHVAGIAALAWSHSPSASYQTVRSAILNGADPKAGLAGKVATGARANAWGTLRQMPAAPAAPSNLTATAISSTRIDLAWTDNSNNESGFKVYRSIDGVNFSLIATVGAGVSAYASTGLSSATTYHYRITSYNGVGESAASNTAVATTHEGVAVPAAPTGLMAVRISSSRIDLSWRDNSANEDGFRLERSTNGRKWSQIATLPADSAGYSDTRVRRNTSYQYRIRAYNAAGYSAYSNTASATTSGAGAGSQAVFSSMEIVQSSGVESATDRDSVLISRRRSLWAPA